MIRELPPLNAFKVFETAARSKSFARAAAELSVNGYISNQSMLWAHVAAPRLNSFKSINPLARWARHPFPNTHTPSDNHTPNL